MRARWIPDPGRRADGHRDAGMTLMELVVAMAISMIVMAGVGTVFVGSLRSLTKVNAQAELMASADIAMRAVTENLRATDFPPTTNASGVAIINPAYNSVTVQLYLLQPKRASDNKSAADDLATAVQPYDAALSAYLTSTQMAPVRVTYAYTANTAVCGGQSGLVQTTILPRLANPPFTSTLLVWDSTPASRCLLRSTTPPTATPPATAAPMFRYFTGCDIGDPEDASNPGAIRSIEIRLDASDTTISKPLSLRNRVCLVNLVKGPT